jgi:hypothetical protein
LGVGRLGVEGLGVGVLGVGGLGVSVKWVSSRHRGRSRAIALHVARSMRRSLSFRYLIVVPRMLLAAPLVVRRRYSIVAPRSLPVAPFVVRRR